jgi:hypothetical protein
MRTIAGSKWIILPMSHFFAVQGGTLGSTSEFESVLQEEEQLRTIFYPAGNIEQANP